VSAAAQTPAATASPAAKLTPEEQAVLAPLQGVLDGINNRDPNLIREQLLPGGMATLYPSGEVVQLHFDAFVAHIEAFFRLHPPPDRLEERIHDPVIEINNDVAIIWAPYAFRLNGQVNHCGIDIATLLRHDGRWIISGLADNSRKNCPDGK
jgi:hypothetical protein